MRGVRVIGALSLLCAWGIAASACDSSESTGESNGDRAAFLSAVASNTEVSIAEIDYDAIGNDDLISAGEAICSSLATVNKTPDGLNLERAQEEIVSRYDLSRAVPKRGAEQDPGVALRNADLRLASAIGSAALQHLCPDQPFNNAR